MNNLDKCLADMMRRTASVNELYYRQLLLFSYWRNAQAGNAAWETVEALCADILAFVAANKRDFPNHYHHTESYSTLYDLAKERARC